jgi:hypothetical protein
VICWTKKCSKIGDGEMMMGGGIVQQSRHGDPMLEEVKRKIYMICPWTIYADKCETTERVCLSSLDTIATLLRAYGLRTIYPPSCFDEDEMVELSQRSDGIVLFSGWKQSSTADYLHDLARELRKDILYVDLSADFTRELDLSKLDALLTQKSVVIQRSSRNKNTFLIRKRMPGVRYESYYN